MSDLEFFYCRRSEDSAAEAEAMWQHFEESWETTDRLQILDSAIYTLDRSGDNSVYGVNWMTDMWAGVVAETKDGFTIFIKCDLPTDGILGCLMALEARSLINVMLGPVKWQ